MENKINKILHSLDKSIVFLKRYSRRSYYRSNEKKDIEFVVNKIGNNAIGDQYRSLFFKKRLGKLLYFYGFFSFLFFSLLIAAIFLKDHSFDSEFMAAYNDYIFLIIFFVLFTLFALNFANLLLNASRKQLLRLIKIRSKYNILQQLMRLWEIKNIEFLNPIDDFDLIRIDKITIYIPKKNKRKKIFLESTTNFDSIIYADRKNIISTFDESYKNKQISEILASPKIISFFKKINIDFTTTKKSEISWKGFLNIERLLLVIFIVQIFTIYLEKDTKKIVNNNKARS